MAGRGAWFVVGWERRCISVPDEGTDGEGSTEPAGFPHRVVQLSSWMTGTCVSGQGKTGGCGTSWGGVEGGTCFSWMVECKVTSVNNVEKCLCHVRECVCCDGRVWGMVTPVVGWSHTNERIGGP